MNERTLLLVEDDTNLREAITDALLTAKYNVVATSNGPDALQALEKNKFDMVISDVQMPTMNGCELLQKIKLSNPDLPVILMTAYGTIEQAVSAMQNGASEYLVKPFEESDLFEVIERHTPARLSDDLNAVIRDSKSQQLFSLAARVSQSEVSVLINGESGVGKEVLARFIHQNSPRRGMPFIAINCAAIPENMLEAVLFGYEKGAFTGAYQRSLGKFELAQNGTLLLDEISEMDLGLQAKLLRVLQEKEVERLGGRGPTKLNVRVLATTNCDLRSEVRAGRFREDLFYRLNVFPLTVPPLRDRNNDILPIAAAMIERYFSRTELDYRVKPILCESAERKLLAYKWPGNIRELENVIQRALVVCQNHMIQAEDLVLEDFIDDEMNDNTAEYSIDLALSNDLKRHEQELILQALQQGNGSRKFAAKTLGISPRTLRYKLSRMRDQGIAVPSAYGLA